MPIRKSMSIQEWLQGRARQSLGMLPFDLSPTGLLDRWRIQAQIKRLETEVKRLETQLREVIQKAEKDPIPAPYPNSADYEWFFKGYVYDVREARRKHKYTDGQVELLILEQFDKERRKFEKLMQLYKSDAVQQGSRRRERIPEHVRIMVWRRDGGKCARCGGREKLEYDHIVPISKGGGNTERNIELLCEGCNREKGDRIE